MAGIWHIEEVKPEKLAKAIKAGLIFIYPTDTVYGLGCDATNPDSVKRLRAIKGSQKPFSVIAPSLKWINANFSIPQEFLSKLPGPYTLIAIPKREDIVCKEVNPLGDSIGVRIPKHPLAFLIQKSKRPFVTTSANLTGEPVIAKIDEIEKEFKEKVDIIIDNGTLSSKPSTVIDLTREKPIIVRN